jgi:hypothetical protein
MQFIEIASSILSNHMLVYILCNGVVTWKSQAVSNSHSLLLSTKNFDFAPDMNDLQTTTTVRLHQHSKSTTNVTMQALILFLQLLNIFALVLKLYWLLIALEHYTLQALYQLYIHMRLTSTQNH